jgi:hypothetical protein
MRFLCRLLALAALAWAFNGPLDQGARTYTECLRRVTDALADPFGGRFVTRIRPLGTETAPGGELGYEMVFRLRRGRVLGLLPTDLRNLGYPPTVFFLALVLVTAVCWRRKVLAIAAGVFLLQLFVLSRLAVRILLGWFAVGEERSVEVAGFFRNGPARAALGTWGAIETEAFLPVIIPLVLWALLAFRREDWERWFWSRSGAARHA